MSNASYQTVQDAKAAGFEERMAVFLVDLVANANDRVVTKEYLREALEGSAKTFATEFAVVRREAKTDLAAQVEILTAKLDQTREAIATNVKVWIIGGIVTGLIGMVATQFAAAHHLFG